jgi:hypothetical protein
MFWTLLTILLVLYVFAQITATALGGIFHIVLVLAVAALVHDVLLGRGGRW